MSYDPTASRRLTPEEIERLDYRLGVGIMLLNPKKEVFVAQRRDMKTEAWQMPQGGIDKGEDPLDTAFREMEEEIDITIVVHVLLVAFGYARDWP